MKTSTKSNKNMDSWKELTDLHKVAAEINEPLVTKDSRENLHDTSKATDVFKDWRTFFTEIAEVPIKESEENLIKKATNYFADTIAEFLPEIGGKKLYECFVAAATQSLMHAEKEYDQNKDLIDLLAKKKK